ncbi:biotin-independent malonate decarboxylase subunit gamma [Providencia burhodogranariea]|uniref:Malonate decarboxylase subunit gamma n=1 Tax=Providencia burhodogranariea DSM 19968 TaxID=1141662 RepID=K8X535_9GAMM|nr:biotin-independent malonate decarboxylase subunit gamma [Providencia burhodogranariea]EKT63570.1 malonate decarboxylase subunit gamma [Providencia burhodogranariea DSM 19968]
MSKTPLNRGDYWFSLLTDKTTPVHGLCASVKAADGQINGYPTRFIAVVPDANNHYPRATQGEVGLLEGWTLAKVVNQVISEDANKPQKRAIVAVIDVPSQAYGRREEAFGIHQALAGAAGAYAEARLAGHPIIGLIVGKAMSGAFLAHGYQANSLIAFNNAGVMIHAMGKESAARITLRSVESLEKLASSIPPMAYDIANYSTLGLLDRLMNIDDPDNAKPFDVTQVREAIAESIEKNQQQGNDLSHRLGAANRQSSSQVRERMRAEW